MPDEQDHIQSLLGGAGADDRIVDAVMRLDAVSQHWRRKMSKRELGRRAIEKLGLPIELSQLDVLFAISAPAYGDENSDTDETMVATVAERLSVDPSRASRMVADVVSAGYARRAVSQADARRTIVELTAEGRAITEAVRSYKWVMMADYLSGWSKEDIEIFVPLLERYTNWFSDYAASEARLEREIDQIAKAAAGTDGDDETLNKAG